MIKKNHFLLFFVLILASSCHVGRFFVWNFADTKDHKKFQNVDLQNEGSPFYFTDASSDNNLKLPVKIIRKNKEYEFEDALIKNGTVAFLIIKNDSILYEKYFDDYEESTIHPSFSIAKSFVSAIIGIAIEDGYIGSVQDPITDYLPELNKESFGAITIEHLLDMQSGIKFNEGYFNPFGHVSKFYYGRNLKKYIGKLKTETEPGKEWNYISVDAQLLGLIVENATQQPLNEYLEKKIWQPLGMEYDASWSIDSKKNKTVKAFCCLNARARDFAKFGRLYLNNGTWNGKQIISEDWVTKSTTFDSYKNHVIYSYLWWHNRQSEIVTDSTTLPSVYKERYSQKKNEEKQKIIIYPYPDFYARGILGQFIYVHPKKNMIIVRLGKEHGKTNWGELFKEIAEMN